MLKEDCNKLKQNLLIKRKIKSIKSYIKGEELTGLYYCYATMILVSFYDVIILIVDQKQLGHAKNSSVQSLSILALKWYEIYIQITNELAFLPTIERHRVFSL